MTIENTRRIVEILASATPEHSLKEAVASALSERVDTALNEYKQRVAESYFGQADLQELSKHTLGSYIKKASHDVTHKGAQTREMANRAREDSKNQNYVGARKHNALSDKLFDKSWNRRKNIAKAVDRLTKEEMEMEEAKKQATLAQKNKAIKAFDKAGKYRPDSKLRFAPLKFKKDRKSAREMSQARYNSSPESEAYWSS